MVKFLRLCIDYGEDHILELKHSLPHEAVPPVETIRGLLHIRPQPEALAFPRDAEVIVTDLRIFDEKCGGDKHMSNLIEQNIDMYAKQLKVHTFRNYEDCKFRKNGMPIPVELHAVPLQTARSASS